jgi:hypothetical protein
MGTHALWVEMALLRDGCKERMIFVGKTAEHVAMGVIWVSRSSNWQASYS